MKKILLSSFVLFLLFSCNGKKENNQNVVNANSGNTENADVEVIIDTENTATSSSTVSQNTVEVVSDEIEEIIEIPEITAELFNEHIVYQLNDNFTEKMGASAFYHPLSVMYVLGFSKDGKMVWCDDRYIDGKGSNKFTLYVQDIVSDEIIQTITEDVADIPGNTSMVEYFVKTKKAEIKKALEDNKIRISKSEVKEFPVRIGQNNFDAKIDFQDTGRFLNDIQKISNYSCIVTKNNSTKKTVTSKKECTVENAIVAGFIKSPYEDRLAVIIAEASIGFEGLDIYYNISGCDLNKNFK